MPSAHNLGDELTVAGGDAMDLNSTADYHQMLMHQARENDFESSSRWEDPLERSPTLLSAATRQWIAMTPRPHSARTAPTPARNAPAPQPAQNSLTREELEEFEALPLAIRRKYFSTLERLRFAQSSSILGGSPNETFDHTLLHKDQTLKTTAQRHHQLQDIRLEKTENLTKGGTSLHTWSNWGQTHYFSDASPTTTTPLPSKSKQFQLSREKQVTLARQLRESVILDAADEAILRIGRRTSRRLSCSTPTPALSLGRPSMESQLSNNGLPKTEESHDLYDSFRWLDEEDDLDLRLYIGDYHANLRETVPTPVKEDHRPSFRRHLSLTKNPFGRSSLSSSRPATKDTGSTSIVPAPAPLPTSQKRRASRALSLVTPKHTAQASVSSIDPGAAHYQDPEARLKLRVYLASPQKFDEAIEFGFPLQGVPMPVAGGGSQTTRQHRHGRSDDSERFKTFLADDKSSTYSEGLSLTDPESPTTPHTPDKQARKPQHASHVAPAQDPLAPERYAQSSAASREMTLRMTLTRPDLRACEDQIYGWQQGQKQQQQQQHTGRVAEPHTRRDSGLQTGPLYTGGHPPKESFDKFFANLDDEAESQAHSERGVVKRFWNRVRRN